MGRLRFRCESNRALHRTSRHGRSQWRRQARRYAHLIEQGALPHLESDRAARATGDLTGIGELTRREVDPHTATAAAAGNITGALAAVADTTCAAAAKYRYIRKKIGEYSARRPRHPCREWLLCGEHSHHLYDRWGQAAGCIRASKSLFATNRYVVLQ